MDGRMDGCMYDCMHVCMYACMHVCMYACICMCMNVYVCVCMCIYANCHFGDVIPDGRSTLVVTPNNVHKQIEPCVTHH